jgi:hypothetical protein
MTFLTPDRGLNERAISSGFAVQLAKNVPQTDLIEPTVSTKELPGGEIEEIKRRRTSRELIAAIAARDFRPLAETSEATEVISTEEAMEHATRKRVPVEPVDEFTASYRKYIKDPNGQLGHIIRIRLSEMIEEAKADYPRDPMAYANLAVHDPGLSENEKKFLIDFATHLPNVIKAPRHRKLQGIPPRNRETIQPDAQQLASPVHPTEPKKNEIPSIEVSSFLSPTARGMLDNMNNAIMRKETNINGDPFKIYINRAVYDTGYITASEGQTLKRALEKYEISQRSR